jgi:hypothetical protein
MECFLFPIARVNKKSCMDYYNSNQNTFIVVLENLQERVHTICPSKYFYEKIIHTRFLWSF